MSQIKELPKVTIHFAGDSGDGIQLAGSQFSNTSARGGNDLSTFPDFPAEIRAPIGTIPGVSGFQVNFGSVEIDTPGGHPDVLVAMNAAALEKNLKNLKTGGTIIANEAGFDKRNLKLAGLDDSVNPLDQINKSDYLLYRLDVTKLTREALRDISLGQKEKDRSRNMFVLGLVYWLYHKTIENTEEFLEQKFSKNEVVLEANIIALKAGYHYGETIEAAQRYTVKKAKLEPGEYRNIVGNEALGLGLVTAAVKSNLEMFYAGYPITPASDILHYLARQKHFGIKTFQAEDEIAAITAAVGASFAGSLAITATSGPGMALKAEGIGLAIMLELPMVIVNVQRGGPSTGLPTKTEQSDLLQALYGRNGEAPLVVLAARSPSDAFYKAIEACKLALKYMTPVILLSDGYIANGAEPWRFPNSADIEAITIDNRPTQEEAFLPYQRNAKLIRPWAIPGMKGFEHRLGGIEKEENTGNVSYDPENHQKMVNIRAQKIENVADSIVPTTLEQTSTNPKLLVLGWGSTYGSIKVAVREMIEEGYEVAQMHLGHLNPLPKDLGKILNTFESILVPELNQGQLVKILREKYLLDIQSLSKVQGLPFMADEIKDRVKELLK